LRHEIREAYKYSETNVMHFLFSLLRIKGLYAFRELLAHLQEALHKGNLVYCMHWRSQLTYHARTIPSAVCVAPPEGEQVMPEHVEAHND
jgi:hypothetical protein